MTISGVRRNSLAIAMVSWSAVSSHGSTASIDPTQAQCARLLTSATQVPSAAEIDAALSVSARQFLALLDVGMSNLGPEFPELLKNLQQLLISDNPVNPFLNLRSPLGGALATRSDPLVPSLGKDWQFLRGLISQKSGIHAEVQHRRKHDDQRTRSVAVLTEVPMPPDLVQLDLERLRSYGETQRGIFFISYEGWLVEGTKAKGVIFRLDKETHEFEMHSQTDLPRWDYDERYWDKWAEQIVGGPTVDQTGIWRIVWSEINDRLLKFDSTAEVALWKYDQVTDKFLLQLHEKLDIAEPLISSHVILDFERYKVVAWVCTDQNNRKSLRVWLPVNLSRGD